ncbi:hypothetical protein V1512DRAFT_225913 [Lipomyces arxii]|uniref:uncharacterized protein n=1 Tax=Lipomyces arxii TaxID=56418 RepID=UPI0034CDB4F1
MNLVRRLRYEPRICLFRPGIACGQVRTLFDVGLGDDDSDGFIAVMMDKPRMGYYQAERHFELLERSLANSVRLQPLIRAQVDDAKEVADIDSLCSQIRVLAANPDADSFAKSVLTLLRVVSGQDHLACELSARLSSNILHEILRQSETLSYKDRAEVINHVGKIFYANTSVTGIRQLAPQYAAMYLRTLLDQNQAGTAIELWNYRKAKTETHTGDMYNVYSWWELGVEIYVRISDVDRAIDVGRELLKRFGKVSSSVRTSIMIKLCEVKRTDLAEKVYTEMFNRFVLSTRHMEQQEVANRTPKLIEKMKRCARAALEAGDEKLGYTIFKDLQYLGEPGEKFAVMLVDHFTQQIVRDVVEARQQDQFKRLRVSQDTVQRLLQTLSDLVDEMPVVNSMASFYTVVFKRLQDLKMVGEMVYVFQRMVDSGVKPLSRHAQMLLRGLLDKGSLDHASRILRIMEQVLERERGGEKVESLPICAPSAEHYGLFLQYHSRRRQRGEMAKIINRMRDRRVQPSIVLFNGLLQDAFHSFDNGRLWEIYDIILSTGIVPDTHTYSIMWRAAQRLLKTKIAAAGSPSKKQSEAKKRLERSGATAMPNNALRVLLKGMAVNGKWTPSLTVYQTVVSALLVAEDTVGALCAIEMCGRKHRFAVSEDILSTVIQALARIALASNTLPVPTETDQHDDGHDLQRYALAKVTEDLHGFVAESEHKRDVEWEDLSRLVYTWMTKMEFDTTLIVFRTDLQKLREAVGLE